VPGKAAKIVSHALAGKHVKGTKQLTRSEGLNILLGGLFALRRVKAPYTHPNNQSIKCKLAW